MCTWQSVSRETGMFQSTVPAWCVQFSKPLIACRPPFVHHFFIRKMGPEKIEHCFRHVTHHDFPRFPPKKSSNFQVSNFSIHSGVATTYPNLFCLNPPFLFYPSPARHSSWPRLLGTWPWRPWLLGQQRNQNTLLILEIIIWQWNTGYWGYW